MVHPNILRIVTPFLKGRFTIEGENSLPAKGAAILAANHLSSLDPSALWYAIVTRKNRRVFTIAKSSLFFSLGPLAGLLDVIFVNPLQKSSVLRKAEVLLRRGEYVLIFPEAHRNRLSATELLPGKTGVARLALATGAPVIPIGVLSPPDRGFIQGARHFFSRAPVRLVVGKPLIFPYEDNPTKERLVVVTREVMQAIGRLVNRTYPY